MASGKTSSYRASTDTVREPEARGAYLAMGSHRSMEAVAQQFGDRSVSVATIRTWAAKNAWTKLAADYDEKLALEITRRLKKEQTDSAVVALAAHARTAIVDDVWILERLRQIVERCMQAEELTDANGEPIGKYKFNATGATKALELLARTRGMFIDRREVGSPGEFDRLSDDELDRYIVDEGAKLGLSPGAPRAKPPTVTPGVRGKPH